MEIEETKLFIANQFSSKLKYRPELDGLRAIAVISVILFHAGFEVFKGGFVGVDMFFVLSGYLMTSIIQRETKAQSFTIQNFYERRARRILPMLLFTISISYLPAAFYMTDSEYTFFTKSAFYSSIGVANIFYSTTTKGYFDTSTDLIPLIHTWTLGVEEQFYVIIPLIFLIFGPFGEKMIISVLYLFTILSFFSTFLTANTILSYYLLHTRFWELAIGSLAAFLPTQYKSEYLSIVGFGMILISIFKFDESFTNPSYFTLVPTVGTALLILFSEGTILAGVLSHRIPVTIGLISYSAYLIHQPLFAFSRISTLDLVGTRQLLFLIFLTFSLAYFSWRIIENPFRDRKMTTIRTILLCFAFSFGLFSYFFLATNTDLNRKERSHFTSNETQPKEYFNNHSNIHSYHNFSTYKNETTHNQSSSLNSTMLYYLRIYTLDLDFDFNC
jgi:peptidoglycan/LPS O-acetylase OafA/YrhL